MNATHGHACRTTCLFKNISVCLDGVRGARSVPSGRNVRDMSKEGAVFIDGPLYKGHARAVRHDDANGELTDLIGYGYGPRVQGENASTHEERAATQTRVPHGHAIRPSGAVNDPDRPPLPGNRRDTAPSPRLALETQRSPTINLHPHNLRPPTLAAVGSLHRHQAPHQAAHHDSPFALQKRLPLPLSNLMSHPLESVFFHFVLCSTHAPYPPYSAPSLAGCPFRCPFRCPLRCPCRGLLFSFPASRGWSPQGAPFALPFATSSLVAGPSSLLRSSSASAE